MSGDPSPATLIHASCVAKDGRAILILGRSGGGKSDLALRLIDRGAALVSDDYTQLRRHGERLLASAPANIRGKMEVRGVGILDFGAVADIPVCLLVDIDADIARLPPARDRREIAGVALPRIAVGALEASAPLKIEKALEHFGLAP